MCVCVCVVLQGFYKVYKVLQGLQGLKIIINQLTLVVIIYNTTTEQNN